MSWLYDRLTQEPRPFPGESKALWMLRRELQRSALAFVKRKAPLFWEILDREVHRENLRQWEARNRGKFPVSQEAKEEVVGLYLRTEEGRRIFAERMASTRSDAVPATVSKR